MSGETTGPDSIGGVARRLAQLLGGSASGLADPSGSDLVFEAALRVRPLARAVEAPEQVWAVDGGQALVADARCLQVFVTRSSRVCWAGGRTETEEELPLRAWLLGLGESAAARAALQAPVAPDCFVDINLLREWGEWQAAAACVDDARPGSLVLVDGDLQPDWRISPDWLPALMDRAADRSVTLVGVTKHTALSWGDHPCSGCWNDRPRPPSGRGPPGGRR